MKIKIIVLFVCLLAFASIGFAQTKAKADYMDSWSNARAFQMSVENATITFDSSRFVSPEYGVITKFVDASGKEFEVSRVK